VALTGDIERLAAIPLFADLDRTALEEIADCAREIEVAEGSLLIERGQPATGMFVILDGSARADVPGRSVELGPGEIVGELSLLTDNPTRSGRVVAATPLRCLAIARQDFEGLLESHPKLAVPMLSVLARRLLDATA
jgi:CRP-like cAMP-binding protein